MRDLLFGCVWAVLLPLSFYAVHLGVLLWIWVALISPSDLLYSFLAGIPFNKLVAISSLLLVVLGRDKKKFYVDPLITLVAIFGILVCLSYVFQEYPTIYADTVFDRFWKELILGFLITGVIHTRHRLHQACIVAALGFALPMVREALIFMLTAGGHTINGTPGTGDNNGLALAILMILPLLLYAARYSALHWVKLVMQITAGLGAVTVVATFSRGGFVGLVVLALLLLGGSKRKLQTFIVLGAFAVIAYYLVPASFIDRVDTLKTASEDDSFQIRLVAWKINFLMALDHPFLGNGLFASLAWQNWTRHVVESSTLLFDTPIVYRAFVAHSIYFQTLGDLGVLGFLVFVTLLLTAIFTARRTRRIASRVPSLAWAADLARALEMSMIVYCVSGAALSLVYFELLFIVLALISRTNRTVLETIGVRAPALAYARLPARLAPAYQQSYRGPAV